MCPAMPSTTSRGCGIFLPVITSVSKAAGSYPGERSRLFGSQWHLLWQPLTRSNFSACACPLYAFCRRQEPQAVGSLSDAITVSSKVRALHCQLCLRWLACSCCVLPAQACLIVHMATAASSQAPTRAVLTSPVFDSRHILIVCLCSTHSSNFVMTAAAQNLLCLQLAASIGVSFDDPFKIWLLGSCVPAVLGEWTNPLASF